ncbi:MAG: NADPH-dependent FMN reductase [Burkholderia gladioli]
MILFSLSGSLRAVSSNAATLCAAAMLAPSEMVIDQYDGVGKLPHYNPDLENSIPVEVSELRDRVNRADGLLISCPEYARGIPGSFKNALDWIVGSYAFHGKPVALFNTSPRAFAAQAALRRVLRMMGGVLVKDACITLPLLGTDLDALSISLDAAMSRSISDALERMSNVISEQNLEKN